VGLQAGNTGGIDIINVRAFNGSYWGDWRKFTVNIVAQRPVVSAQTANQTWQEREPVNFLLAANTFTDPQNDALSYKASLSNGAALPSWLQFNAETQTFWGMVPNNVADLNIRVSATNTSKLTASETFAVRTPAPTPPIVANQTATQRCATSEVNFTLAADTFTHPSGGTLAYAATLPNGAPLPSWLSFNAATETFTGIMPTGTLAMAITVTATATNSLSASETFVVAMARVADQFSQAIAGTTSLSGANSSATTLTFAPAPQDQTMNLAPPAH
jgi:putative Ig domain-containing protein